MAQRTLHPKDHPRNNHEVSTNQVENKNMIKRRLTGKGQSCLQSLLSHDLSGQWPQPLCPSLGNWGRGELLTSTLLSLHSRSPCWHENSHLPLTFLS